MEHAFRILNVFVVDGQPLSGNPLCVFERGERLTGDEMQALARQLNLSETTFLLPASAEGATARVRIFTPSFEMPFAGHPTLGSAHVVRALAGAGAGAGAATGDRVVLEMIVGLVEVTARGDEWTLRTAQEPATRPPAASRAALAAMLRLPEEALAADPLWVDTGSDQLVIPLRSPADVAAARPVPELLERDGFSDKRGASMAYVWARAAERSDEVVARFFFTVHGSVVEDPATGSACANLGGYLVATGHALPLALRVRQGDAVGRPSSLGLRVDDARRILVTGTVKEIARGTLVL